MYLCDGICETCEDGVIVDNDLDNDGVCDADEVFRMYRCIACNYDSTQQRILITHYVHTLDGICDTCEDGIDSR